MNEYCTGNMSILIFSEIGYEKIICYNNDSSEETFYNCN